MVNEYISKNRCKFFVVLPLNLCMQVLEKTAHGRPS